MWFQIILVLLLVSIGAYLLRSTPGPRHLAIRRVVLFVGLLSGIVVIIWPGLLSELAAAVGVGRGVDLLFYLAIVAGLLYVVNEYKRSIRLTRANSRLTRELVLAEARLDDRIAALEKRLDTRES